MGPEPIAAASASGQSTEALQHPNNQMDLVTDYGTSTAPASLSQRQQPATAQSHSADHIEAAEILQSMSSCPRLFKTNTNSQSLHSHQSPTRLHLFAHQALSIAPQPVPATTTYPKPLIVDRIDPDDTEKDREQLSLTTLRSPRLVNGSDPDATDEEDSQSASEIPQPRQYVHEYHRGSIQAGHKSDSAMPPNMNHKKAESPKEQEPQESYIRGQPPFHGLPDRPRYTDRSLTTSLTAAELAAKDRQIDNHPSAKRFQKQSADAEVKSKPEPGYLRTESDPEIKRKQKATNRAIGYRNGPPVNQPDLMEDWMKQSLAQIQADSRTRSQWPQQETYDREVERMRKGVLSGSQEESPDDIQRREQREDREKRQIRRSKAAQVPPTQSPRASSSSSQPSDELNSDPDVGDDTQLTIPLADTAAPSAPLPRSAIYAFNGTPDDTPGFSNTVVPQSATGRTNTNTNTKMDSKKRRHENPNNNKALDSNLGDYWAPQVDESGGRPKKKPRKE